METSRSRPKKAILLAEDDIGIRKLIRATLRGRGYEVVDTERPDEALALAAKHPRPIDLLITDSLMEEMSGADLAVELTRSQPALKVLFISGYANADLKKPIPLLEGQSFLQKPFSMQELAERVRKILDD